MSLRPRPRSAGFTLIEAIMVIVITGILAGIVAVFISKPVEGYIDSVRRAELTDAADVALRRMTRDIRLALPNSLRVRDTTTEGTCTAGTCYIEFIMTSAGGRYRDSGDGSSGAGLKYLFSDLGSFDVVGLIPPMQTGDLIAVYNLGPGYSPADAYGGLNVATVGTGTLTANPIPLSANPFPTQSPPLPSPNSRFQVVPGTVRAVTFACPIAAGSLTRYWNYGFNAVQPTSFGVNSAVLATGASCTVDYASAATGRSGLLFVQLTLTSGGESVSLFQQIHVDNAP